MSRVDGFKTLNEWRDDVHALALKKGWYDCRACKGSPMSVRGGCNACNNEGQHRNPGELIALIHSELSEALEALRLGHSIDSPEVAVELVDVLIRTLDMCGYAGIDVDAAMMEKHSRNADRPRKHGKVF